MPGTARHIPRLGSLNAFAPFRRDEDGATAVEFALVFPMLAILMLGLTQLGLYQYGHHSAQSAADRTARQIMVMDMPSQSQVEAVLAAEIGKPAVGTYATSVTHVSKHGETFSQVKVDYTYSMKLPFIKAIDFASTSQTETRLRDLP